MPWSGSGSFSRSNGTFAGANVWAQDNAAGFGIEDARQDTHDQDLALGIQNCLTKDGQNVPTTDLPMNGQKHTGVGNATARNHYASLGQIVDGTDVFAVGGGTGDAITATLSPAVTTLVDGMELNIRAPGANTVTTPTFSPNGITAHTITREGGSALAVGDYASGQELKLRYVLASTRWELLNPKKTVSTDVSGLGTAATQNTGTSGANVPLLNGDNTHGGKNTFSKQTSGTPVTGLATTGTITLDLSTGNNFHLGALTGATTFANPTNAVAGQSGVITVSTNGQTTDWGTNFHWPNGVKPAGSGGFDVYSYYVFSSTFIVIAQTRAVA